MHFVPRIRAELNFPVLNHFIVWLVWGTLKFHVSPIVRGKMNVFVSLV